MKKILTITMIVILLPLLVACGGNTQECRCTDCNQDTVEETSEELVVDTSSSKESDEVESTERPKLSKEEFQEIMKEDSLKHYTIYLQLDPDTLDFIFWAYANDIEGTDFTIIESKEIFNYDVEEYHERSQCNWMVLGLQRSIGLKSNEAIYWLPYGNYDIWEPTRGEEVYEVAWENITLEKLLLEGTIVYNGSRVSEFDLDEYEWEFEKPMIKYFHKLDCDEVYGNISYDNNNVVSLEDATATKPDKDIEIWHKGEKLLSLELPEHILCVPATPLVAKLIKDEVEVIEDYVVKEKDIYLVTNKGTYHHLPENVFFASLIYTNVANEYYVGEYNKDTMKWEVYGTKQLEESSSKVYYNSTIYDVIYGEFIDNTTVSLKCINMNTMETTTLYTWNNVYDAVVLEGTDDEVIIAMTIYFMDGTCANIRFDTN